MKKTLIICLVLSVVLIKRCDINKQETKSYIIAQNEIEFLISAINKVSNYKY